MVRARRRLPGEPREGIVTLAAGQMGVADAIATKPAKTTTALCAEWQFRAVSTG